MTKEELKLEALKYLENFKDCANCKHRWGDCADELDEDCLINNCYSATPKEQDIYLAGAEPREKRIAELEKRCNELFFQVNEKTERIAELEKENADLKEEINKIAFARGNLEEENAELKEQIAELSKHIVELQEDKGELIDRCRELETRCNELFLQTMQLTKAKELLKQWLQTSKASGCDNINIVTDTEQFLKDN